MTPARSSASCRAMRVDDGGQHPHVVGGGAVHARGGVGDAAEDVPAADHRAHLRAQRVHALDLVGQVVGERPVDAEGLLAQQRLAGELEQDAFERGFSAGGHVEGLRSLMLTRLTALARFHPLG